MLILVVVSTFIVLLESLIDKHREPMLTQEPLEIVQAVILAMFTLEITIKIVALGKHPNRFFDDGWNNFDFFIVVASLVLMPLGTNVSILRTVRLLQLLKVLTTISIICILPCYLTHFSTIPQARV